MTPFPQYGQTARRPSHWKKSDNIWSGDENISEKKIEKQIRCPKEIETRSERSITFDYIGKKIEKK